MTKLSTAEDPGCPGRQWRGHRTGGKGQGGTQGAQSYSHEPGRLGTPRQKPGEKWKRHGGRGVGVEWDGLDRQLHEDREDRGVGSLPCRTQVLHAEGAPPTWWEGTDRRTDGKLKDALPTSGASRHGTELEEFSISPGRAAPLLLPPRLVLPCQWGDACQGSE